MVAQASHVCDPIPPTNRLSRSIKEWRQRAWSQRLRLRCQHNSAAKGRVIVTVMGMVTVASIMALVLSRVSSSSAAISSTTKRDVPYRVLAFGDSLTAGFVRGDPTFHPYANALQTSLERWAEQSENEVTVDHVGKPGWTSEQLYGILPGDLPYDVIIILAGTNDLGFGSSAEAIISHLRSLHDVSLQRGVYHTMALAIPPSAFQQRDERARLKAATVNSALKSWSDPRITFVPFPFPYDSSDSKWHSDGLHLSKEGYDELGLYLAPPGTS